MSELLQQLMVQCDPWRQLRIALPARVCVSKEDLVSSHRSGLSKGEVL